MSWFTKFLTSSIGRKLLMSLTGLFLIIFLLVHLIGNLQLLIDDGGEKFNLYAELMTSNPLIKTVSYGLYFFILLHTVQGIILMLNNRRARSSRYAVYAAIAKSPSPAASRYMGPLGIVIFVFILIHMWQFWFQMKIGAVDMVTYGGHEAIKDLYTPVAYAFTQWWYVVFYVISMVVIAFHLSHGFQSAFQTLGINHKKYSPWIRNVGIVYSILIPLGFALIPIYFFLFK